MHVHMFVQLLRLVRIHRSWLVRRSRVPGRGSFGPTPPSLPTGRRSNDESCPQWRLVRPDGPARGRPPGRRAGPVADPGRCGAGDPGGAGGGPSVHRGGRPGCGRYLDAGRVVRPGRGRRCRTEPAGRIRGDPRHGMAADHGGPAPPQPGGEHHCAGGGEHRQARPGGGRRGESPGHRGHRRCGVVGVGVRAGRAVLGGLAGRSGVHARDTGGTGAGPPPGGHGE
jgi:hypothetical protein